MTGIRYFAAALLVCFIGGCASQIDPAMEKQHQLQIQRMQTKVFDTNNRKGVTRGVIAALQDLDFVINNLDTEQGIVVAKKFGTYPIEMTVTIQPVSNEQVLVHGIAQSRLKTIDDPFLYEQFFSSLQSFLPVVSIIGN
jgi:hypothetical protein